MATQQTPMPISMPQPQTATKFALTVSVTDFQLALGHSRMGYTGDGNAATAAVEYPAAFVMSPSAVKQLSALLVIALKRYEEQYGAIPQDVEVTRKLEAGGRRATVDGNKVVPISSSKAKKSPAKKR